MDKNAIVAGVLGLLGIVFGVPSLWSYADGRLAKRQYVYASFCYILGGAAGAIGVLVIGWIFPMSIIRDILVFVAVGAMGVITARHLDEIGREKPIPIPAAGSAIGNTAGQSALDGTSANGGVAPSQTPPVNPDAPVTHKPDASAAAPVVPKPEVKPPESKPAIEAGLLPVFTINSISMENAFSNPGRKTADVIVSFRVTRGTTAVDPVVTAWAFCAPTLPSYHENSIEPPQKLDSMIQMAAITSVTFRVDGEVTTRLAEINAKTTKLFFAMKMDFHDEQGAPHEYRYIFHVQPGSLVLQEHYDPTGQWNLKR